MSTTKEEENKEIANECQVGLVNTGDLVLVDEHIADDWVGHFSGVPEPIGPEGLKDFVSTLRTAFPDIEQTVEDQIAQGDKVASRGRFTGTHEGEFMGIEPTGQEVDVQQFGIARFEDGEIVETWSLTDTMGLMQQLGVIEPPG